MSGWQIFFLPFDSLVKKFEGLQNIKGLLKQFYNDQVHFKGSSLLTF